MRLILKSSVLLLLFNFASAKAHARRGLETGDEYVEAALGPAFAEFDDGDVSLDQVDLMAFANDDLDTCDRSAWKRVGRKDTGTMTGSLTVDVNSGNPFPASGVASTLTDGCNTGFVALTGTRDFRGMIIENTETNGHLNCDNSSVTFRGTGTRVNSSEIGDLRSKSVVQAGLGDFKLARSITSKIKGGTRYSRIDTITNGVDAMTETGFASTRYCSPGRRKQVDLVNSTRYSCSISTASVTDLGFGYPANARAVTWTVTSPTQGIPADGINVFLNFTKNVEWDPLFAPKGAGTLAVPNVDGKATGRVSTKWIKMGGFNGRLDNQGVLTGVIRPIYFPTGANTTFFIVLQYGATFTCNQNTTVSL